jgi:PAS domain S-box-containing protein
MSLPEPTVPANLLIDAERELGCPNDELAPASSPAYLEETLRAVLRELSGQCKEDYTAYKPGTVLRRVSRRMALKRLSTPQAYVELLRHDGSEARALADSLKIGFTGFFRDEASWDALREALRARLLAWQAGIAQAEPISAHTAHTAEPPVWRLWVCGCSSGEEAYSWAMVFREACDGLAPVPHLQIFATDLDPAAIAHARAGVYPRSIESGLSHERLSRFFTPEGSSSWRVHPTLRGMVTFATHNVLSDPPFGRLDFLSCRNLLIYLQPQAQQQVLGRLQRCMQTGAWLMLGQSEALGEASAQFAPLIDEAPWLNLFRLREPAARADAPHTRLADSVIASNFKPQAAAHSSLCPLPLARPVSPAQTMPKPPRPDALHCNPSDHPADPAVPQQVGRVTAADLLPGEAAPVEVDPSEVLALKQSLQHAREELQRTRHQAQQTREELMSRMEELQATHEELTTSFEELRTLADALTQDRAQAQASLAHFGDLFDKAPVATLVLGPSGEISQANALAGQLLGVAAHLLPGHSLLQYAAEQERSGLRRFLELSCSSPQGMSCEVELRALDLPARWLQAVSAPLSQGSACVLALVPTGSVTTRPTNDPAQVSSLVAQATSLSVALTDLHGRILWVNRGFTELTGYSAEEAVGRVGAELMGVRREAVNEEALAILEAAARQGRGVEVELVNRRKDGSALWCRSRIDPVFDDQRRLLHFVGVHIDRTAQHLDKEALKQSLRLSEACQRMTQLGAWELDLASEMMVWTRGMYRLFDVSPTEFTPSLGHVMTYLGRAEQQQVKVAVRAAVEEGKPIDLVLNIRHTRHKGMRVRVVAAVRLEGDKPAKLYGAMQQVTRVDPLDKDQDRPPPEA